MISIIIPCYRSEKTIYSVVQNICNELQNDVDYEIILVNDGSPDNVWQVIKELAEEKKGIVHGVCFSKNFGQHAALLAGYREAKGDIIISMDDDGQCNVKGIRALIEKIEEGYDVVYARYPVYKSSLFRRIGSRVNRWMSETLIDKPKGIQGTSFNALRKYVVDEMLRYNSAFPYIGGLTYRTTNNIAEIEIEHSERIQGESGYSLKKLLSLWMNGFTAFSIKPLRFATFMGFLSTACSIIWAIVVFMKKIMEPNIQAGYSSIIIILLFIGGMIMMMLGLIGEYIGRIYMCINQHPQSVIKEKI